MADTTRPRLPPLHIAHVRNASTVTTDSDSSVSSPAETDDDRDAFMIHLNDSQSTIGPLAFKRYMGGDDKEMDLDMEHIYRTSPVQKLPAELLITILSKLTTTRDLRNCMLVSYSWAVCAVNILWHRPLIGSWDAAMSVAKTLAASPQSFPYSDMVKRINMSAVHKHVNDVTMRCFFPCKNVERLTLTSCMKITDLGIEGLLEGSKRLQALDVTDLLQCTDRSIATLARNCPKLQGLNVTNCSYITDDSISQVAYGCRHLKRLKLNGVSRLTDQSILTVANFCRSILEIDLQGCHLVGSASVTAILINMPHLRELRLTGCIGIDNRAFTDVPPHLRFESMRVLDLTACDGLGDDAICRILPQAPRLRNLVLAKCRHITDVAVRAICTLTKNLHYIHLGHCTNLSDQAVIDLVHYCNRIRYIDLACCSRLTDLSIKHLARLPKLRRIGLVKCQNLTDESIIALARGPFNNAASPLKPGVSTQFVSLERVHLSYCTSLTLKGITELLLNCPRLTHLSLTGVQAFLRDDLTRFCRDAPTEFTHTQRDVFCVFSGDGVKRLQEYLERLALEETERDLQQQGAPDEPVVGPNSPDADSLSDGTIDGADPQYDFGPGHGRSTLPRLPPPPPPPPPPRSRPRPRSLHDLGTLSSFHVDMPFVPGTQLTRVGPWMPNNPNSPELRDRIVAAHRLPVGSSSAELPTQYLPRTRSRDILASDSEEFTTRSRSQSRRYTVESADRFFGHATLDRRQILPDRSTGPSEQTSRATLVPSSSDRRSRALPPVPYTQSQDRAPFLDSDPDIDTFVVNENTILATVPTVHQGGSRDPSRSSSPAMQRISSRSRVGHFLNSVRAASGSQSGLREGEIGGSARSGGWGFVTGRSSRQSPRPRRDQDSRREVVQAATEQDVNLFRSEVLQNQIRRDQAGRDISILPFLSPLPANLLAQLDQSPATPGTPVDSRSSPITISRRRGGHAQASTAGPEVVMADLASALPEVDGQDEGMPDFNDIDMS